MSTRGTIAFIFYNETDGRYYLETSQQFQYDMAPGMNNGSCLLDCFDEFYLGKRKHCRASMKPFKLIEKFAKKINVDLDVIPYEWHMLRTKQDGTVVMDLRKPKKENGKPDYKNDFLTTALHYSDWIYIMPLCDVSNLQIIGETDDFASYPYTVHGLPRNELQIFHYRNLKYTYDGKNLTEYDVFGMGWPKDRKKFLNACREAPIRTLAPKEEISEIDGKCFDKYGAEINKNGNYVDERDAEYKRECRKLPFDEEDPTPEELLDDIFDDKPVGAPPLNTNVLPQKRFVEILTQYKDGDRYCLVVRDSDNKHVIFKEMK